MLSLNERHSIIAEAEINGQTVIQFAPKTQAAETFIMLAKEISDPYKQDAREEIGQARAIR